MISCFPLFPTMLCLIFESMLWMQNDMMRYFREDLHRRLLSTDFKKQVDGLEMLQKVFCFLTSLSI